MARFLGRNRTRPVNIYGFLNQFNRFLLSFWFFRLIFLWFCRFSWLIGYFEHPYLYGSKGIYNPWTWLFLCSREVRESFSLNDINEDKNILHIINKEQISLKYHQCKMNISYTSLIRWKCGKHLENLLYTYRCRETIISYMNSSC